MKIFVVVPLFNEEKHIAKVLKDISIYKLPIVVVDDGSTDRSRFKIQELRFRNVKLLEHKINLGKGAAMKTGAEYAFSHNADAIIFMDSDGQHESADLPKFIKVLESEKYDVVFGSRNYNYGVPLIRFLGNKFAALFISILFRIYVSDILCGFRGLTKKAYNKIEWDSVGYGVESEMVARVGKNNIDYTEIPVQTVYHDKVKGVTILDSFGIMGEVVRLRLTLK